MIAWNPEGPWMRPPPDPAQASVPYGPLHGSVDLLALPSLQEHRLDLFVEEFSGPGVSGIQTVVVDEEGLVLEPFSPAVLADLFLQPLTHGIPERCLFHPGGIPLTTATAYRFHWDPR